MKLLELLNGVDYKVLQGSDEKEINKIQYDSRKIAENDLFVCLSGFEVDGHDYAINAINAEIINKTLIYTNFQIVRCSELFLEEYKYVQDNKFQVKEHKT